MHQPRQRAGSVNGHKDAGGQNGRACRPHTVATSAVFVLGLFTAACGHEQDPLGPEVVSFRILGNDEISDGDIKEKIVTEATGWWPFAQRKEFDPVTWDKDRSRVERLYASKGFYHAKVEITSVPAEVARDPDAEVKLTMHVQEGPRATVGDLEIEGAETLPPEQQKRLTRRLPLKEGGPFTEEAWEATKDLLEQRLEETGHAKARLEGQALVELETNRVDATVWLRPGPVYTFGDIVIKQASPPYINPQWIREQVRLEVPEGAPYSPRALVEAQKRVFAMNVFGRADVELGEVDPETGRIPVLVATQTAPFHLLRLGGGAGFDQVRNEVRLLAEWSNENFMGGLRSLRLRSRVGWAFIPGFLESLEQSGNPTVRNDPVALLRADFVQPRLFGAPAWKLGLFAEGERQLQEAFTATSGRAGPEVIWQILSDLRLSAGYALEGSFVQVLGEANRLQNEQLVSCPSGECPISISYLTQRATFDWRDEPLAARRGIYFDLQLQEAGGPLQGTFTYLRTLVDLRGYVPFGRFTLAGRVQAGSLFPRSGNVEDTPIQHRLYAGGGNSFRGFSYRRLSPLLPVPVPNETTPATVVVGGNGLLVTNLELRYGATKNLLLAAFYDTGTVPRESLLAASLTNVFHAVGGGLRYLTPVGAIRLDIARRFPTAKRDLIQDPAMPVDLQENTSCFGFGGSEANPLSDGLCQIHISIGEAF